MDFLDAPVLPPRNCGDFSPVSGPGETAPFASPSVSVLGKRARGVLLRSHGPLYTASPIGPSTDGDRIAGRRGTSPPAPPVETAASGRGGIRPGLPRQSVFSRALHLSIALRLRQDLPMIRVPFNENINRESDGRSNSLFISIIDGLPFRPLENIYDTCKRYNP